MIVYMITDAPKKKHVIASQCAHWRGNLLRFAHRHGGSRTSDIGHLFAMTAYFCTLNNHFPFYKEG